jgi:MoxR-like ATPase
VEVIPSTIDDLAAALEAERYHADRALLVALHLSLQMGKPLLLEGEPGVGKTEIAKVLASITGEPLIRLQCYEGLDVNHALYEWDYARQMLAIRLMEAAGDTGDVHDVMSRDYLRPRPLLEAIEAATGGKRPVLLIDEVDRADEEFEAFLLELLSDFQITIPEVGTIRAEERPIVVVTSNRTREIHDALKRRCIYHWIDYPAKVPGIAPGLAGQLADAMVNLRTMDLFKPPGVAETIDWATALAVLGADTLTPELADETLGVVVKYQDDLEAVRAAGGVAAT